ncbi:hypothetical membrane protein, conserved [Thermococcus onnurineus NA1]|uniref:Hypothetical membrane protein, conserved n=1 Tax=Thermococcus onnurineus (strain NA1) TaxID=523850 RepID=B6YW42_THEON|nr:hypothetical protein [Thermococcus onnurineus]ACJ17408.1 hypothetical membrane protein, conserved [Thermococcus onnurineus NA1]
MDFALFMERYGYRILVLVFGAAILGIMLAPFVMTFWAFSSSGIAAAVIAVIVLAIGIALMVVLKFWNFADKMRQTHVIEDWNEEK